MTRPKTAEETWVRTPVPAEVHRQLKAKAALRGVTMIALVIEILTAAVQQPEA